MNKKILIIALIISVAINLAAIGTFGYFRWVGQGRFSRIRSSIPPWIAKGFDWNKSHLKNKLGLNEEQIEKLNTEQEAMRIKTLPYMKELFDMRNELMSMMKDDKPDSVRADSIFKEIVSVQIALETHVFNNMQKMRDIFTSEQRQILMKLFEEHMPSPPFEPRMLHERMH